MSTDLANDTEVAPEPDQEYKMIDCDSHITEPIDLWSARASESWKDRMPQQRVVDGRSHWYIDGKPWASTGGNTIQVGREKVLGTHVLQPFDLIDRSAWSVPDRLALLDMMGVSHQVVFPNGVGFSSNHIFAIEDIEQRGMVLKLYNDFLVDVHVESKGRLIPQAILPIWDMDETVAEMNRLMNAGIRGFTLSDRPELLGLGELNHEYFAPMWSLFNEAGAVANFHIAAGRTRDEHEAGMSGVRRTIQPGETVIEAPRAWSSFSEMRALAVSASQSYVSNLRIITNLCMSDMFDRYPKLKIISAESGIGWIPFLLESLEWQCDEMLAGQDDRDFTKRRPSEYFHDHIYVMFWFERHAPQTMVELVGVDNILVETDVPHPTCLFPNARAHFDDVLAGWDERTRRRILRENAAELYRIDT